MVQIVSADYNLNRLVLIIAQNQEVALGVICKAHGY